MANIVMAVKSKQRASSTISFEQVAVEVPLGSLYLRCWTFSLVLVIPVKCNPDAVHVHETR